MIVFGMNWQWDAAQWSAFLAITAIGLLGLAAAALAIRTVRGWTAPATYRAPAARPRPSLQLAERRPLLPEERQALVWQHAPGGAIEAGYAPLRPGEAPVVFGATDEQWLRDLHVDPTGEVAEHFAPGAGSLTTLREVGEGSLAAAEPSVDPDVHAEFERVFAALFADFRVAIEPAMRTAHLWEIRGRGHNGVLSSARRALDEWRINTPTGEWPMVSVATT